MQPESIIGFTTYSNKKIYAYYNDENSSNQQSYRYGQKWECVEFVRRWLSICKNISFISIESAFDLFSLSHGFNTRNQTSMQFQPIINGSKINHFYIPIIGTILVWKKNNLMPDGHVAIIVGVFDTHIYIAEQNFDNKVWTHTWSRTLYVSFRNNYYTIHDRNLLGWILY